MASLSAPPSLIYDADMDVVRRHGDYSTSRLLGVVAGLAAGSVG